MDENLTETEAETQRAFQQLSQAQIHRTKRQKRLEKGLEPDSKIRDCASMRTGGGFLYFWE